MKNCAVNKKGRLWLLRLKDDMKVSETELNKVKLILIGSCRNDEDQARVDNLKELSRTLGVSDKVEFYLNFSFEKLIDVLTQSAVGIHSMINEHFGIGKPPATFSPSFYSPRQTFSHLRRAFRSSK